MCKSIIAPKIIALILSLLISWSTSVYARSEQGLPHFENNNQANSLAVERDLAFALSKIMRGSKPLYTDAIINEYLDNLILKLSLHADYPTTLIDPLIINNNLVNAFALPGGIVGLHSGIIMLSQNEAQLASVIAHELAHLSQRHHAQQKQLSNQHKPLVIGAIITSILLGDSSNVTSAAITSGFASLEDSQMSFSRKNEQSADYIGMHILTKAGYPAQSMPEMFQQLQNSERFNTGLPEFLSSHPVTQNRISDSLNRAALLKKDVIKQIDTEDFLLIKIRIQLQQVQKNIDALVKAQPSPNLKAYARFLFALKNKDFAQATQAERNFSPDFKNKLSIKLSLIEQQLAQKSFKQADKNLNILLTQNPSSYPILKLYADSLITQQKYKQAVNVLLELTKLRPKDPLLWYELAETEGLADNNFGIHSARIEYFIATANIDLALQQLEIAQLMTNLSQPEQNQLNYLKKKVEYLQELLSTKF